MKTKKIPRIPKKELAKYLVHNYTNGKGVVDLTGLDFRKYNVYVDMSGMKTKFALDISNCEIGTELYQRKQVVGGFIRQDEQNAGEYIGQDYQTAKQGIYQSHQKAKSIFQIEQSANIIYTHKPTMDEIMIDKNHYFEIEKRRKRK